jgi:hypothetical protein
MLNQEIFPADAGDQDRTVKAGRLEAAMPQREPDAPMDEPTPTYESDIGSDDPPVELDPELEPKPDKEPQEPR